MVTDIQSTSLVLCVDDVARTTAKLNHRRWLIIVTVGTLTIFCTTSFLFFCSKKRQKDDTQIHDGFINMVSE